MSKKIKKRVAFSKTRKIAYGEPADNSWNLNINKEYILVAGIILSFLGGIIFISKGAMTGNVIGQASVSSNWIGCIFFVIGLFGLLWYADNKNN